ncbi:MAG: hypothetical protein RSA62_06590 [Oscillospiraceae bacterium]
MAKKNDIFNYKNPKFEKLHAPMRELMDAFGSAERFFAHIKEVAWYDFGMRGLSDGIHRLEHLQPERVDVFADGLRQLGLFVEYPPIEELTEPLPDLDRLFQVCVGIVDEIDLALSAFIAVAATGETGATARIAEQLQVENSGDRTKLLEAWSMWDRGGSAPGFDAWCARLFKGGEC